MNRSVILTAVVETIRSEGATNVNPAPKPIEGTHADYAPDVTYRQADDTPTIVAVVLPKDLESRDELVQRLTLFDSAAKLYSAELHVVVPDYPARVERDVRDLLAREAVSAKRLRRVVVEGV
jgi:hypothetical protein